MKMRVYRVLGLLRINGDAGLVSELEKENRLADLRNPLLLIGLLRCFLFLGGVSSGGC